MWRGVVLSGLAHAALIALALRVLPPWLNARDGEPVPAVAVSLVTPAELAAAEAAARRRAAPPGEPARATPPEPAAARPQPVPLTPEPEEAATRARVTLAPGFDPDSPLGLDGADGRRPRGPLVIYREGGPGVSDPALRPRPRSGGDAAAASAPVATDAVLQERFERAVRAAVARAQVYPVVAAARGVVGTARVEITVDRRGRLLQARLLRSSGSASLDRASLDATLVATLPAAPTDLPGESFGFELDLFFGLDED